MPFPFPPLYVVRWPTPSKCPLRVDFFISVHPATSSVLFLLASFSLGLFRIFPWFAERASVDLCTLSITVCPFAVFRGASFDNHPTYGGLLVTFIFPPPMGFPRYFNPSPSRVWLSFFEQRTDIMSRLARFTATGAWHFPLENLQCFFLQAQGSIVVL